MVAVGVGALMIGMTWLKIVTILAQREVNFRRLQDRRNLDLVPDEYNG